MTEEKERKYPEETEKGMEGIRKTEGREKKNGSDGKETSRLGRKGEKSKNKKNNVNCERGKERQGKRNKMRHNRKTCKLRQRVVDYYAAPLYFISPPSSLVACYGVIQFRKGKEQDFTWRK